MQRVRAEHGSAPRDAPDAHLHELAVEHVARVRERCQQFTAVDDATFVVVVVAHLAPLDAGRPWLSRRWQARWGEGSWLGGAVGLHVPRVREAS